MFFYNSILCHYYYCHHIRLVRYYYKHGSTTNCCSYHFAEVTESVKIFQELIEVDTVSHMFKNATFGDVGCTLWHESNKFLDCPSLNCMFFYNSILCHYYYCHHIRLVRYCYKHGSTTNCCSHRFAEVAESVKIFQELIDVDTVSHMFKNATFGDVGCILWHESHKFLDCPSLRSIIEM